MGGLGTIVLIVAVIWVVSKLLKGSKSQRQSQVTISVEYPGRAHSSGSRRFKNTGVQCWRPKDQQITIGKDQILGGMIYTGQDLPCADGYRIEPALIDPTLPVDWSNPDTAGQSMSYWPSYSDISPQARAAYLHWLSGGRKTPDTNIGYVFLFFYGLERRMLVDGPAIPNYEADALLIAVEVRRLLDLYGNNRSFQSYAGGFLNWIGLTFEANKQIADIIAGSTEDYGVPLATKIELARKSLQQEPIPVELALAWVTKDPDTNLGVAAKRCGREFEALFKIAYAKQFGCGMTIKPNRTMLRHQYRPASAGIQTLQDARSRDLPDLTQLKAPVEKLRTIARTCVEELASYSRAVGKLSDVSQKSIAELALLPANLLKHVKHRALQELSKSVQSALDGKTLGKLPAKTLLSLWPTKDPKQFNKKEHTTLAVLLQALGYGIEPDPRFGGGRLKSDDIAVLFAIGPDAPTAPRDAYLSATLLVQLASAVAASDGNVSETERERLENRLEQALHLDSDERSRLKAHFTWNLETKTNFTGVAKRIEPLTQAQRKSIGEFLVTVAGADGGIDSAEIRILEKIYKTLDIPAEELHSTIHQYELEPAREPVLVRPAAQDTGGLPIPPPPKKEQVTAEKSFKLDMTRIQKKMEDTRAVQQILKKVFDDDVVEPIQTAGGEPGAPGATVGKIPGLDEVHAKLFYWISERPLISAAEFEDMCEGLGLMPGGAIETLNSVAFEVADEALLEDEDPLTLNANVAKTILDGSR